MRRPLLAFLLLATTAWAQAPTPAPVPVPAPAPAPHAFVTSDHHDPVPPGVLVTLDADGSSGDDVGWDSDADESYYKVDTGGRKLYFASPVPGTYRFKLDAYGIADGKIRVARAKVTITVRPADPAPAPGPAPPTPAPTPAPAPGPTPAPGPGPTPAPAPVPVSPFPGHLHATLFYDVNDWSVVPFRADATLRDTLRQMGVDWYMLATTSPAAQPFASELAKDGTPVILFQDDLGNLIPGRTMKSPKSPAELIGVVQSIRSGVK